MQVRNARFGLNMANDNVNICNDNANMEMSQMISEKDVQTYQRDGVIVVPEVLGADTLAKVRSVIAELVAGSAKTLEHTDVYDLEPGHTAESPRVRRIKTPHKVHEAVRRDRAQRSPCSTS